MPDADAAPALPDDVASLKAMVLAQTAELAAINPEILVCLGATAARVIFGDSFRITRDRGRFAPTRWTPKTIATYHPSAVLRGQDEAEQARLYAMLVEDLRKVADA